MATITLRLAKDGGQTITATTNLTDANAQRMIDAFAARLPGKTNQEILDGILARLRALAIATTQNYERNLNVVDPID